MDIKNFEFKAKVESIIPYEESLLALHPDFKGTDRQIDTYFNARLGRLKLREGNIENALIQYDRADVAGSKLSEVILYKHENSPALKKILADQLGVKVVVDKLRKIYFIDNVKFHFDIVEGLGEFIEVEAQAYDGDRSVTELEQQCRHYLDFFKLSEDQLIQVSYSDMLLELLSPNS